MDHEREPRRKDRLIQARVPRELESTLKREARRRRLTVSHLIRNVLEDTFQLVDDVVANVDDLVNDSVELARRVGRDARRVGRAVREAVETSDEFAPEEDVAEGPAGEPPEDVAAAAPSGDPLAHVYAWQAVVSNRATRCTRCATLLERGAEAWVGLSDDPERSRTWLCPACRGSL